jgi:hypothetical protein
MLAEIGITLNIRNNRTYPIQISVLGGPVNPLDTVNATTEYRYDVTALSLTSSDTLVLKYKVNGAANFSTFTAQIVDGNIESIVIALNTLGIGYFQFYVESGQSYFSTYNDNYEFGQLEIISNVGPPPPATFLIIDNLGDLIIDNVGDGILYI